MKCFVIRLTCPYCALKRILLGLSKPLKQVFGINQPWYARPVLTRTPQTLKLSIPPHQPIPTTTTRQNPRLFAGEDDRALFKRNPSKMNLTLYTFVLLSLALALPTHAVPASNEAQRPLNEGEQDSVNTLKSLLESWNPKTGRCYPSGPAYAYDLEAYDCETGEPLPSLGDRTVGRY